MIGLSHQSYIKRVITDPISVSLEDLFFTVKLNPLIELSVLCSKGACKKRGFYHGFVRIDELRSYDLRKWGVLFKKIGFFTRENGLFGQG